MAKIPPFIYSKYNDSHFIVDTKSGITNQVHIFDNLPDTIEFEHNSMGKAQSKGWPALGSRTSHQGKFYVLVPVRYAVPVVLETQADADNAAKHFRRMADWFLYSILRENKLQ
ncbi:hypothetical protein [uncultured Draconibacterium sp.]|uniref:hypothetical protein n=1 Tax=uncultured Draconibacterium sp. TaxID=1573823 RepID=UPI0025F2A55F|nr:hypothetical protein [uncultured Draconibacterium sp.]